MTRKFLVAGAVCGAIVLVGARLLAVGSGSGSISFTGIGVAYTQNFDTLASTGPTASSLPNGWYVDESGTNANTLYSVGTGSSNAGDTYSFGASGSSDRALGTLQSGSLIPTIGASFTNNTGATIGSLSVSYVGEEWRLGTAARQDRLDFQYSLDATSLTTGTWTDVNGLDFSTPDTAGTAGLRDGNSATERTAISGSIGGLSIPNGATVWIRWQDFNATGADDGLAVDDFTITPQVNLGPTGSGSASPSAITSGQSTTLRVDVTPGVPPASIESVTANLQDIGGAANQAFTPDASNLVFTFVATVPQNINGSFSLPATIKEAGVGGRTGTATIPLTVSPPPPPHFAIHDIQGPGSTSPVTGMKVETDGIVTARRFNNGFFIQTPDDQIDADPNTSEGIFVFTSTAPPAIAAVGSLVRVTGTVAEFLADAGSLTATELTSPTVVLLDSNQHPLPAPTTLTADNTSPNGPLDQLERFEGMRVHVETLNVVAPTQGTLNEAAATAASSGVYYGVLPGIGRPFREPGLEQPTPLPPGAPPTVTRFDGNPERLRVDSNGNAAFGAAQTTEVATGATVSNITGVLDYSTHAYTILPDPGAQGTVSGVHAYTAVSAAAVHRFTIATANLERFFDTVDDAGISDVALTTSAYQNRRNKVALQICDVMRAPDIIGVEEVENIDVLRDIAASANGTPSCGGSQYTAILFEGNDPGGIDDGFLVNLNRVAVRNAYQEGKDATYTDPNTGSPALLNDRPPTVLLATIQSPGDAPADLTVIANHLRSLNGIDDDPPGGGGDGNRVRTKRLKQAEFLGHLIESLQGSGEPVVAVGDFNAFEFSDGYVDVIGTIKGTPAPANQVVLASTDVPNTSAPLVDLIESDRTANRYSYSFDGNAQSLDHVLATQAAVQIFDHIEWGHSNADFPESMRADATRPERLSDHDPVVAYFVLAAKTTTTVAAAPNPAPFGQDIAFTATVGTPAPATSGFVQFSDGAGYSASVPVTAGVASVVVPAASFGVGVHTMAASFADGSNFAPSSGSTSFTVVDVVPPAISGLVNVVVEANGPAGTVVTFAPTATDDVDGSVPVQCAPASGFTFPLGDTTVTCTATDKAGNIGGGSFVVTVRDTTPPTVPILSVAPSVLWPANHKMVGVAVTATSTDTVSSVVCAIKSVTSNEPDNGVGDGDTANDIGAIGGLTTTLRAERSGSGSGRVYTIGVSCADRAGNVSVSTIDVTVPKNR